MDINLDQIKALAELALEKKLVELTVSDGGQSVTIKTVSEQAAPMVYHQPQVLPAAPGPAPEGVSSKAEPSPSPKEAAAPENLYTITAPMVGSFYRSPSPDSPPFIEVGQTISAGQTLCIIEAMKLMNELESDVSGKVVRILVENGQPVEFGQPLIQIEQ